MKKPFHVVHELMLNTVFTSIQPLPSIFVATGVGVRALLRVILLAAKYI